MIVSFFGCLGPLVRFLPHVKAEQLNPDQLQKSDTNPLGERAISELLKTGSMLAKDPWSLLKTQHWLEALCHNNENRIFPDVGPLLHIFHPDETLIPVVHVPADMEVEPFETPAPRTVQVVKKSKTGGLRRPSARMQRPAAASPAVAPAVQDGGVHVPDGGPADGGESEAAVGRGADAGRGLEGDSEMGRLAWR